MTRLVELQCATACKQISEAVLGKRDRTTSWDPQVWPLAKANYLLLALWRSQKNLGCSSEVWGSQLSLLKQLEKETTDAVRDIIPRFTDAGLPLMAIKSFLPFPYVDSNLDLLTGLPDHLNEYVRLLQQLGYKRVWNLADVREPMKQTYQTPDVRLRLHLHTAVSWNGIIYLPFDQVWQRRCSWKTEGGQIWISSVEDELLIMAAHALFENKLVSLHEVLYWYRLVTAGLDWKYIMEIAQCYGWHRGILQFTAVMSHLAKLLDIPVKLPLSLAPLSLSSPTYFPYIFPVAQNWHVTGHKLAIDLRQGMWRGIPRRLFSYILVDHLWMYRKAYRKKREVMTVCS
jgi:hypothetical protein